MIDLDKKSTENKELQNSYNPLSDPYSRINKDFNPQEKRNIKSILKSTGEELIINSKRDLTNMHSQKSIFSPRNNSNKKSKKVYDPYLISVCKNAIIRERKNLPNYKEVIRNINTEFGIEETEKQNFDLYFPNKNRLTINIETNNMK